MNYNFKALYKAMFTEHWKLSLVMLAIIGAVLTGVMVFKGIEPVKAANITLGITIGLITLKAVNTLIRAKLLIHFAKKGHWQLKQIYVEWING